MLTATILAHGVPLARETKDVGYRHLSDRHLAAAREARDEAKRLLGSGADPSAAKRERKRAARLSAANTFEPVAREWHENWKPGRTVYYAWQVMRRLEADVFPEVGGRPINEIEPPELLDMLRKVESRGAHETALRIKQLVGQIFRYAIVTSRAKRDPSADLKGALKSPAKTQHHRSMPRDDELPAFLRGLEAYNGERRTSLALKLVTLTFLRTTELRARQWPEIEDLDGLAPLWGVPPERMKKRREHLVPLPRQAVPLLKELRALAGNSTFIFPSPSKERCMSNNTMLYGLYRMGYHGRATTHGFRGVASTILNENNFNSDWIEMQLAHLEGNEVRRAYNAAEWLPDRRRMMQWWGRLPGHSSQGGRGVPHDPMR